MKQNVSGPVAAVVLLVGLAAFFVFFSRAQWAPPPKVALTPPLRPQDQHGDQPGPPATRSPRGLRGARQPGR